jgi:quercetin dioxygenase-like cupin family protein
MQTKLQTYQQNVKRLAEMVASIGEPVGECGLDPPKIFPVEGGEARVWVLFENDHVSIAKAFLSPGARFPEHTHGAMEFIVVYEGEAWYHSADHQKRMKPGVCVSVLAGKAHRVEAGPEGAWFSVTTVPREEALGYVG